MVKIKGKIEKTEKGRKKKEKNPRCTGPYVRKPLYRIPLVDPRGGEGKCVFDLKNLESVLAYDILTCHV